MELFAGVVAFLMYSLIRDGIRYQAATRDIMDAFRKVLADEGLIRTTITES
jgi:hypothetical protein